MKGSSSRDVGDGGPSDVGGDEEAVEVQVHAGRDRGPGDFCEGLGVEDEHER